MGWPPGPELAFVSARRCVLPGTADACGLPIFGSGRIFAMITGLYRQFPFNSPNRPHLPGMVGQGWKSLENRGMRQPGLDFQGIPWAGSGDRRWIFGYLTKVSIC